MKIKNIIARVLCAVMAINAMTLGFTSCARKDELGNRYSSVTEGMETANALVSEAKGKSDLIADIEYDIALMVHANYNSKEYDLGVKNSYWATGRNTETSEIYCTKTYYGANGNVIDAYYRHDGHMYLDFCNTLIRVPISEGDFYTKVENTTNTASLEYFKSKHFASGRVYGYSDGTQAAVFDQPSAELTKNVAEFLGLEGSYIYEFSDVYLRCEVGVDGTVTACRLDFVVSYHDALNKDSVVT